MLRRKITEKLIEWKNGPDKRSLLIRGARQVGKTYSVEDFGKKNYGTYIYINFEEKPSYTEIFAGDRSVNAIIEKMSAYFPDAEFTPGDTLIFLDEIQNCPDARVSFKFFTIDGRYDVIGTGSLLGVRYKEVSSYPVGYEDIIDMYSLDFEEFLWAMDVRDDAIGRLKESIASKRPLDSFYLSLFGDHFRRYVITGGMPKVVTTFKETNHFGNVAGVQRKIVSSYLDDITKYASGLDKNKVRASFGSIPAQLSKRNKKFVYADVEGRKDSRYDTYGSSLSWLCDAGIISFCYNLQEPAVPLASNVRLNAFKVYMRDTGLLVSMMEKDLPIALLNDELQVNEGAIMENIVAEMLIKAGYELMYFERKGTLEVGFILNLRGTVTAVEVKSGNNKMSKSLDEVMSERYNVKRGIKLENTNIYVDEKGVEHYPIFAAAFIGSME